MNLSRRGFLSLLGAGAAGLVLDPERLLWKPGAKRIFLPTPARVIAAYPFTKGDVFTIAGRYAINPLTLEPVQTRAGEKFLQQFVATEDVRRGQEVLARAVSPRIATASRDGNWEPDSRCDYFNGQPLAPGDHVAEPYLVGISIGEGSVHPVFERWAAGHERGFVLEPPASAFRPEARARLLKGAIG